MRSPLDEGLYNGGGFLCDRIKQEAGEVNKNLFSV
jgi:hypothetical protein